jgi:chromosome segregation ATPase
MPSVIREWPLYTPHRRLETSPKEYIFMAATTISVDEFQALEQRVLRTIELIKQEREARANAEAEVTAMKELLDVASSENSALTVELAGLKQERESVKGRVDAMLKQLDDLG